MPPTLPTINIPTTPPLPSTASQGQPDHLTPPTFHISPAEDEVLVVEDSPLNSTENSPVGEIRNSPSSNSSHRHHDSDGSISFEGGTTSLALRGNTEPNAKRHQLEKNGYPPSPAASSTLEDESRHRRSPSATTIPDGASIATPKKGKSKKEEVIVTQADPSPEEMKPFTLVPSTLYSLIDPKSIEHLKSLGGIQGVLKSLMTNANDGLNDDETSLADRQRVYGINRVPDRKGKSLLRLMWMAYQDKVLLILSVAAVVSLALGLYQDLGTPPQSYASTRCANNTCYLPQVDYVEGIAITVAIFIVVIVGAVNDWQKERQFKRLNAKKEERDVKVMRNGTERMLSIYSVVVGDVVFVEPGEILPCDGIYLQGHNVRCDESGATGESDLVRKIPYGELIDDTKEVKGDCFLISGSKVVEGVGTYVVTSVGPHSFHGKIMMSLRSESEDTPLQLKLNALAELIAKLGAAAGLILFTCLMIRFFVQLATNPGRSPNDKAQNFIQILIISVTIVVVAVPEGLPLAVTLALAFATRRMMHQGLLVRVLGACETMANATVICTDKTGTLTQNRMSVVAGSIGVHLKFADRLADNASRSNANRTGDDEAETDKAEEKTQGGKEEGQRERSEERLDFSTDMTTIDQYLSPSLRCLLNDSITINSTAFEGVDDHGVGTGFVGSKTETALLAFAQAQGWRDYKEVRQAATIVQMISFSSERKVMGAVFELSGGRGYRVLFKGASEVLAKLSNRHVVVVQQLPQDTTSTIEIKGTEVDEIPVADFTNETRENIRRTIIFYANQSLRTIALCARDFAQWPPVGAQYDEAGDVDFAFLAQDLTLVAVTAIEDPLRDGVSEAVMTCQTAGVAIKMCTGDNVLTARSIAAQCGIYSAGGIIMEGPAFRRLTFEQRQEIVPRLQVLARSSPEDKKILVEHLKSMGEIVGVTGDGTNDGPALKTANVGFSMGIAGTEVAKEASDIILMDDNFSSIVDAIMWGRAVNDSVKKFLQFQISVNITAVIITFISAVASSEETSVLTAVQLLWVNLIMDTFAALALATDPADRASLRRQPDRKAAPLITTQMWLMILSQAVYQTVVALVLHFAGAAIFNYNSTDPGTAIDNDNELKTLVFNTFVFCQIFNQLNARRLDRGFNVFTGILKNYYFIAIFMIMVGGQILIVEVGGAAFQVVPIGGRDWAISIILGFLSLPLAAMVKLLSPEPFERLLIRLKLYPDPNAPAEVTTPVKEEKEEWNEGIGKVIDNLTVFAQIRGGRMRSSSMVLKSRSQQMRKHDIHPTSLMAMVPSLVMGAIGAGWTPKGSLSDPASFDPSRSSTRLFSGHPDQHPQTDRSLRVPFDRMGRTSTRSTATSEAEGSGGRGHERKGSTASYGSKSSGGSNSLAPPSPTRL